jgi:hypothetical protein
MSSSKSMPKKRAISVAATARRFKLFGPPLLLEGEDAAAYDRLFAGICAAVKPADTVDQMFIADVVSLEWEVLRWRRLKFHLIRVRGLKALENFLRDNIDCELYEADYADILADILGKNLPEDQRDTADELADACARDDKDAIEKVRKILVKFDMDKILNHAKNHRAEELAREYGRHKPKAIKLVNQILADASLSIDAIVAKELAQNLDDIEQIDRLVTIAEGRRDSSLHEIERHRAGLGEMVRRSLTDVENAEFKVIETSPANGKNAA